MNATERRKVFLWYFFWLHTVFRKSNVIKKRKKLERGDKRSAYPNLISKLFPCGTDKNNNNNWDLCSDSKENFSSSQALYYSNITQKQPMNGGRVYFTVVSPITCCFKMYSRYGQNSITHTKNKNDAADCEKTLNHLVRWPVPSAEYRKEKQATREFWPRWGFCYHSHPRQRTRMPGLQLQRAPSACVADFIKLALTFK